MVHFSGKARKMNHFLYFSASKASRLIITFKGTFSSRKFSEF
ncbi:MAG: hypothetical protein U5L45_23535 [Saprospiraceae bacterium]|nr:hypothetical protein [Saprospiraceae bacterium]